jgi:apolipoprotein N-acyltransferase
MNYSPVLLRDRPRPVQIILGGVIPAALGALQGVLIGVSPLAYWIIAVLAGVGAFIAGFEHRDGWGGADRGFFGGLFYGIALLVVHGLVGNTAKVSLGSFPPLLAVLSAIIGMFLGAAGGRIARMQRERQGIFITDEHIAAEKHLQR